MFWKHATLCYSDNMTKPTFHIIRPVGLKPLPNKYEERIAEICAEWFQSDVAFVMRGSHTTPDIKVIRTNQYWEIKNITGSSKHTIEDNLRKASKQSDKVIISLLNNSKIDANRAKFRIISILKTQRMPISSVLLKSKTQKVIDIK